MNKVCSESWTQLGFQSDGRTALLSYVALDRQMNDDGHGSGALCTHEIDRWEASAFCIFGVSDRAADASSDITRAPQG